MQFGRAATLAFTALLVSGSCKDGNTPTQGSSTTTSTVPTATQSSILVSISAPSQVREVNGSRRYAVDYSIRLQESAGLGANIDFLRLDLTGPSSGSERTEIGGATIASRYGTNRVPANGTWSNTVTFEFNLANAQGPAELLVQVTDDRRNQLVADFDDITPPGPAPSGGGGPGPGPSGATCNGQSVPASVHCGTPTAKCNDGTWSCSQNRSGTCSSHGGVACWVCPGVLCLLALEEGSFETFEVSSSMRRLEQP
jgi:hypothetical protein